MVKKILIKLIVFLLPIIILLLYIEVKLSNIPNSYSQKKLYFEKHRKHTEIIVVGNSHELFGINPEYFSHSGFNLANVGQSSYYDAKLILKNLDLVPNLKLVILPVCYFSFFTKFHHEQEIWRSYFYYHFWGITYKDMPLFDSRKFFYITLYTKDEVLEYLMAGFKVDLSSNSNEYGYVKKDTSNNLKNISDSLGKVRAEFYEPILDSLKPEFEISDIVELIEKLNEKHIKTVIISSPVYKTFLNACNKHLLSINDSIIHNICSKYGCPYFNYLNDTNFAINDYFDNDHLNSIGAEKFSKMVDSEIIRPIFEKH